MPGFEPSTLLWWEPCLTVEEDGSSNYFKICIFMCVNQADSTPMWSYVSYWKLWLHNTAFQDPKTDINNQDETFFNILWFLKNVLWRSRFILRYWSREPKHLWSDLRINSTQILWHVLVEMLRQKAYIHIPKSVITLKIQNNVLRKKHEQKLITYSTNDILDSVE